MFKAGVGSLADFTGEKLAKSCSDDMLAQFVIQTTFSIGVQKGIDKAAKSFGKGFSNKMSKYVGKAGATSTKGSAKLGDANLDMPETLKVKEPEVHSESPMFGEDWNSYFREKYGEGNVTWESAPEGHIDNPKTLTYKTFEKGTFSSGFDYESMYEQQYLDDFSYEEHFTDGKINEINTKDVSKINDQDISYASFEGEYEPIKLKSKDYYPESPMSGEDWNSYFQDKYGSKNVNWETRSVTKTSYGKSSENIAKTSYGKSSENIAKTSYEKSIENTEFFKENGGLDASDYISIHSRKHMYNPDTLSTPKKTQYGKDVNVGELCKDTIMNPDEVVYNTDQNVMIYKKKYPFNISTSETPTGTHRVFIPLNTQGKKTIRMSQFPLFEGD